MSGIAGSISDTVTKTHVLKSIIHRGPDHVICPQMNSIRVRMQEHAAFTHVS